jgi:hypothetical protein
MMRILHMAQTPNKNCWCRNGGPPTEITSEDAELSRIPEEMRLKHRRFWKCVSYCDLVSTIEGGQRIALGYLAGEKWTPAHPHWHKPLPLPVPKPKRGGGKITRSR